MSLTVTYNSGMVKKPLYQRVHEVLNRLGLFYQDICSEANINEESLTQWVNQDPDYDYADLEVSLEKWVDSKYQRSLNNDEKQYYQIRSQYLKRLDINQQLANQWLEAPNIDKIPQNDQPVEYLIPISIDIELDGQTFKENIIWNYYEPYFTPENFAHHLAKENRLSPNIEQEVVNVIRRALQNYRFYDPKERELIRTIELNILIENVQLKDRFEWDINDFTNSPEQFAFNMCNELGLSGEFAQRIAYQIREQILSFQKQIMERRINQTASNFKKSTRSLIESSQNFTNFDPKIHIQGNTVITEENYLRPVLQDNDYDSFQWEPKISILQPDDIRKVQKEEQRKQRLMRRTR
ncbi:hypothetical protein ABPG74_014990 [Tetrahymena malaccensis]